MNRPVLLDSPAVKPFDAACRLSVRSLTEEDIGAWVVLESARALSIF